MITAGIDAGSRAIKVVLLGDGDGDPLAETVGPQGIDQEARATWLCEKALEEAGLSASDVARVVATGYGRKKVPFAHRTITEITCHARGIRRLVPEARTIIEIGGQDSKLIRLDGRGAVRDFAMNDRCAAGTGRFLEMVANRFDVCLSELGDLAVRSKNPAVISSMCVVFAETEIIGLLAAGAPPEDIVGGVQHAIATRVAALGGRRVAGPVVFTGGVAMIPGMDRALEGVLDQPVTVAPRPQFTGALGAALLAREPGA